MLIHVWTNLVRVFQVTNKLINAGSSCQYSYRYVKSKT